MFGAASKVKISQDEELNVDLLNKGDRVTCVSLEDRGYNEFEYPIKEVTIDKLKSYNFYFLGGILTCDYNQEVLCSYRKILPIGDAVSQKIRIHTSSGLILPHLIENCRQPIEVFNIKAQGWGTRAIVAESVYCV